MMIKVDIDRAAEILVQSIYQSDKQTAREWGISTKTIQNYRKRMSEDDSLSIAFQRKRELVESSWVDKIGGALLKTINFIERASEEMDTSDPEALHAVTGSFKILAQTDIARMMINARYGNILENREGTGNGNEIHAASKVIDAQVSKDS